MVEREKSERGTTERGTSADAEIVLHVTVTPPDGPAERTTYRYTGRWWRRHERAFCRYVDPETAAVVTLKVADGTLTLLRQGEVTCRQAFRAGEAGRAWYRTPYGAWPLVWRCRRLDVRLLDGAAAIRFSYEQELGGQYLGMYDVLVEVVTGRGRGEADAHCRLP